MKKIFTLLFSLCLMLFSYTAAEACSSACNCGCNKGAQCTCLKDKEGNAIRPEIIAVSSVSKENCSCRKKSCKKCTCGCHKKAEKCCNKDGIKACSLDKQTKCRKTFKQKLLFWKKNKSCSCAE